MLRTPSHPSHTGTPGTGDKGGECGMDADELAAFMRSLDLDLNPAEAMLVSRGEPYLCSAVYLYGAVEGICLGPKLLHISMTDGAPQPMTWAFAGGRRERGVLSCLPPHIPSFADVCTR